VPRSGLTTQELFERSSARWQLCLDALASGSPRPFVHHLANEREDLDALLLPHSSGARDELANRLFEMARNRDEADLRAQEHEIERKHLAVMMRGDIEGRDELENLNMKAIRMAKKK
jgi:hypothetical protein